MNVNLEVVEGDMLEMLVMTAALKLSIAFPWLRWHQAHSIAQTALVHRLLSVL